MSLDPNTMQPIRPTTLASDMTKVHLYSLDRFWGNAMGKKKKKTPPSMLRSKNNA